MNKIKTYGTMLKWRRLYTIYGAIVSWMFLMHTKCIFQGPCKETTLAVYMAIKKCACGPNLLMANDMALGTPNAKLFFFLWFNGWNSKLFGANAKNARKWENPKSEKVAYFPSKSGVFFRMIWVFKFLAFSSHFFRIVPSHFMHLFRTYPWWCYTQPCESSSGIVFGVGLFPGVVGDCCPCRRRQKHCHLGLGVAIHWTKVSLIWTIRCWIANKNTKVSKKNSTCLWDKIEAF